jgi:hypothetical protein
MPPNGTGSIADLETYMRFLARTEVDIAFSIEDCVADSHRVGYRLFGEGRVGLSVLANQRLESGPEDRDVSRLVVTNGTVQIADESVEEPQGMARIGLHVTVECVGLFRISDGKLIERWGPMSIGSE